MKKNHMNTRTPQAKVATVKSNTLENGIVIFIGLLLCTNFLISLKILFG